MITECECHECQQGRPDACETVERTRYAVRYEDTGMVVGDGETEEQAWEDAEGELANGAGSTAHQDDPSDRSGLECVPYDASTHEVELSGGIVVVRRRRS